MPTLEEDKAKSFDQVLLEKADDNKFELAFSIIKNAKEGDASALKIVQSAMETSKFQQEDKLKISKEKFREIIKLAADRLWNLDIIF